MLSSVIFIYLLVRGGVGLAVLAQGLSEDIEQICDVDFIIEISVARWPLQ